MEETSTAESVSSRINRAPIIFIPARLDAKRLPRKPLVDIEGLPMIARVVEAVGCAVPPERIVVVSDSAEVLSASERARPQPGHAVLIDEVCRSGSERVSRAYQAHFKHLTPAGGEWIINVQGDEPLLPPSSLKQLIKALPIFERGGVSIVTLAAPLAPLDPTPVEQQRAVATLEDRAAVKACLTLGGLISTQGSGHHEERSAHRAPLGTHLHEALYFTRAPAGRHLHIGVYAFHTSALHLLDAPRGPLSLDEDLEQLTWMERGARIGVVCLDAPHPAGVDTPSDLERARLAYRASYVRR